MEVSTMIKNILSYITFIASMFCAVMVVSVSETADWWQVSRYWMFAFALFATAFVTIHNVDEIRRYTYPAYVCLLAWAYQHKLICGKLSHHSSIMYEKYNSSYSKLYENIQDLYDKVVFSEV